MFWRIKDKLEGVTHSVMCAKSSIDLALSGAKCNRLLKDFEKREARKQKEIYDIADELKELIEDTFSVEFPFSPLNNDDILEYTDDWNEKFRWMSEFISDIMEQIRSKQFIQDAFEKDDIQRWINYVSDPEIKKNIRIFDTYYQTNMLTWTIQQCNKVIKNSYPEYEDIRHQGDFTESVSRDIKPFLDTNTKYEDMFKKIAMHTDFNKRNPIDIGIELGYSEEEVNMMFRKMLKSENV